MKTIEMVFIFGFMTSLLNFLINIKNILKALLSLELLMLTLMMYLMYMLMFFSNMEFMFVIFICMSVCEGVLGLAILVRIIRTHGSDYFMLSNLLW